MSKTNSCTHAPPVCKEATQQRRWKARSSSQHCEEHQGKPHKCVSGIRRSKENQAVAARFLQGRETEGRKRNQSLVFTDPQTGLFIPKHWRTNTLPREKTTYVGKAAVVVTLVGWGESIVFTHEGRSPFCCLRFLGLPRTQLQDARLLVDASTCYPAKGC